MNAHPMQIAMMVSAVTLGGCASDLLDDKKRARVTAHGDAAVSTAAACLTEANEEIGRTVVSVPLDEDGAARLTIISSRSSNLPRRLHAHEPTVMATIDVKPVTAGAASVEMNTPPVLVNFRPLPVDLRKELSGCGLSVSPGSDGF